MGVPSKTVDKPPELCYNKNILKLKAVIKMNDFRKFEIENALIISGIPFSGDINTENILSLVCDYAASEEKILNFFYSLVLFPESNQSADYYIKYFIDNVSIEGKAVSKDILKKEKAGFTSDEIKNFLCWAGIKVPETINIQTLHDILSKINNPENENNLNLQMFFYKAGEVGFRSDFDSEEYLDYFFNSVTIDGEEYKA